MNSLKLAAGVLALADAILGLYLSYTEPFMSDYGELTRYLFWTSVVLLVVSVLCLYGVHYAFPVAAVLAAGVALDAPFAIQYFAISHWALVALSLVTAAANLLAFRTKSYLSEQANPLNLPVFG